MLPHTPSEAGPAILLVDNGSLEPGAVLGLRTIAEKLGAFLGRTVEPVSLLHSSAIPAEALGGRPAEILEPALERRLGGGVEDFLLLPLFFGPSLALTDYIPRRVAALKARFPGLRVRMAAPLVDEGDERMAAIIEDRVRARLVPGENPPAVILVDHGSPARAVVEVRNRLARELQVRLGSAVRSVLGASMERRRGPEYEFGDPLLERALDFEGFNDGPVIVALLFVSPGRHAGAGGDVDRICAAAQTRHAGLRLTRTELVGSHPGLIDILADRLRSCAGRAPL